nr:hypothetical protein CFP56_30973 [Quercus suber]
MWTIKSVSKVMESLAKAGNREGERIDGAKVGGFHNCNEAFKGIHGRLISREEELAHMHTFPADQSLAFCSTKSCVSASRRSLVTWPVQVTINRGQQASEHESWSCHCKACEPFQSRFEARDCYTTQDMRCRRREPKCSKQRKRPGHLWALIRCDGIGETATATDGSFLAALAAATAGAGKPASVMYHWFTIRRLFKCSFPPYY